MTVSYKGFDLSPAVELLRESGKWTTRVQIIRHNGSNVSMAFYDARNTFAHKSEAEEHSLEFGKQVIDGQHKNMTVNDLL